jgi:hypothetical protein
MVNTRQYRAPEVILGKSVRCVCVYDCVCGVGVGVGVGVSMRAWQQCVACVWLS